MQLVTAAVMLTEETGPVSQVTGEEACAVVTVKNDDETTINGSSGSEAEYMRAETAQLITVSIDRRIANAWSWLWRQLRLKQDAKIPNGPS